MSRKKKRKPTGASVDIIVAVYGGLEFLKILIESLDKFDAGVPYNLIIADDCTPLDRGRTELYDYYNTLSIRPHTKVFRSGQNRGFAGIYNWSSRKCSAPLILLLNPDTEAIEDGWLTYMVDEFNDWQVGVVGAKLIFPDDTGGDKTRPAGTIQHAGVAINILGQPFHVGIGWPPDDPRVNFRREHQIVTAACMMTRRKLYSQVGGLNEIYTTGNFEDCEYCVLVGQLGYKIIYQPKTQLIHYSGGCGNFATAKKNEAIFRFRMSQFLSYDHYKFCLPWKEEYEDSRRDL